MKVFCDETKKTLIQWMGTAKAEKAIPFLVLMVATNDPGETARRALETMGPELGKPIETELAKVVPKDKRTLLAFIKILGAVGTKDSIPALKNAQKINAKDIEIVRAGQDAIDAITLRSK
jgi:hypothetical protein